MCNICAENKSDLNLTICKNCNYICCKNCYKQYIRTKNSLTIFCMNCNISFTRNSLVEMFGITYVNNEFQKIQNKLRIEKQIALLPTFIETAKTELQIEKEKKELDELLLVVNEKRNIINNLNHIANFPASTKIQYVRPCSVEECKGFLNTSYKCELCDKYTCKDCLETVKDNHVCDENTKASATLLKKDTKNCPNCGTGIYKIDGCFGENTEIPLWNGTIKKIQDILIGDILIGDDGNPRKVLNTFNGEDNLYEVKQKNGINYIVNSKHELVLKYNENNYIINVENYININNTVKNELYGFKSNNSINWEHKDIKIDPYLLGLFIDNNQNILTDYIINSEEIRLNILAGIIDSYGFIENDDKIIIIQTNLNIVKNIEFIARSLGFLTNIIYEEKKYIINILGYNIYKIPTKLYRKKCNPANYNKDIYKTKITVEPIGKGKYYGFELDKNHLFVLTDMTVQKNCSQIWCTICHTAFDWKTGEIEKKRIHNPHYYEYLRKISPNGEIPREEQVYNNCNNIINDRTLRLYSNIYTKTKNDNIKQITYFITESIRYYFHISHVKDSLELSLRNIEQKIIRYNIDYIKNIIVKEIYEKNLSIQGKKQELFTEKLMIMNLLVDTITDILTDLCNKLTNYKLLSLIDEKIINELTKIINDKKENMEYIIKYCVDEDKKLIRLYNSKSELDILQ